MKATDKIYPFTGGQGEFNRGVEARDFIAIEAMKIIMKGVYPKTVSMIDPDPAPKTISGKAYAIADAMIEASE